MGWIIERIANNLDTVIGAVDILSGVRRILASVVILMFVVSFVGCTYSVRTTERIGASETQYALSWGASTAAPESAPAPRPHTSKRRALRESQPDEVAASPLGAKWYK